MKKHPLSEFFQVVREQPEESQAQIYIAAASHILGQAADLIENKREQSRITKISESLFKTAMDMAEIK